MHRGEDRNFMWFRDQLSRDLPQMRNIIYGYDTKLVMSESFQTLDDIAIFFIVKPKTIGRSSLSAKPLVFLCHSLGGVVLKRALVFLAESGDSEICILETVKQIIFFGLPSRGMKMSHLLSIVQGQFNQSLVELLFTGSARLKNLDSQFSGISLLNDVRLVSIHETLRSPILEVSA